MREYRDHPSEIAGDNVLHSSTSPDLSGEIGSPSAYRVMQNSVAFCLP